MINFATLLTQEQVERTHAASLEILENVGLLVRNEKARSIFKQHGCQVDAETQIVKFPPAVVEKFRAMLPPTFTFYGRDPSTTAPSHRTGRSSSRAVLRRISSTRSRAAPGGPVRTTLPASRISSMNCPLMMSSRSPRWQTMRRRDNSPWRGFTLP